MAIAIARSCIRAGSRGRFFTTIDLVNRLEAEAHAGRQGRLADYLTPLETSKKRGAGGAPKLVLVGPRPFNWLRQTAVTFEASIEMSNSDMEHQLNA